MAIFGDAMSHKMTIKDYDELAKLIKEETKDFTENVESNIDLNTYESDIAVSFVYDTEKGVVELYAEQYGLDRDCDTVEMGEYEIDIDTLNEVIKEHK